MCEELVEESGSEKIQDQDSGSGSEILYIPASMFLKIPALWHNLLLRYHFVWPRNQLS